MLTVGVDLAAADERTAMASIVWSPGRAVVRDLVVGVSDAQIVAAVCEADKAGLDCPLGWPEPFADLIAAHRSGHTNALPVDGEGAQWRRAMVYRTTDEVVRSTVPGVVPLSASADRLGHAAMRCAALLAVLANAGQDVDRCGDGAIVEVYPAASLYRWGLIHRRYKGAGREAQHELLVDGLVAATGSWLDLGPYQSLCRRSHDAFDSVIAALTARAAAVGLATQPSDAERDVAKVEGWIAVPTAELGQLVAL